MMMWTETWKLAVNSLRANKLRALLTMLGVIIGSACIVLVVTVALAGKKFIIGQIEAVGSNIVYASLQASDIGQSTSMADEITLDDMEAVKHGIPQVVEVAGTRDFSMTVVAQGKAKAVSLVGVTQGFQKIRNLQVVDGRSFGDGDLLRISERSALTERPAKPAFPLGEPVGQTSRVGALSFTVIGSFRVRVQTFGQAEIADDTLLEPFPHINYLMNNATI